MAIFDQRAQKVEYQYNAASVIVWSEVPDRRSLREWWHMILRQEGRYQCYSIFLVLPSDKEALQYLMNFGTEIDLISDKDCLIITLGQTEFNLSDFTTENWSELVKHHANDGYSVRVARLFDIEFNRFPCLLIFRDIRTPDYVTVPLGNMTAEEIAKKMRSIFSIIHKAVADKKDPLTAIENQQSIEGLRQKGQTVVETVSNFAGKTFEKAMEAWINATIK